MITIKLNPEDYYIVEYDGKETLAYDKDDNGIHAIAQDVITYLQDIEYAKTKEEEI